MRLVPRSIAGRMVVASVGLIVVAVLVAGAGTAFTTQRFIRGQIDQRLDAQIASLSAALSVTDGRLTLRRWVDAPPFDRPRSGWTWQARAGNERLASQSLGDDELPAVREGQDKWLFPGPPEDDEMRGEDRSRPRGPRLYLRSRVVDVDATPVMLTASAPLHALYRPMWDAMRPVAMTMLVLGVAMTLASILLLRTGLGPLGRLRREVEAVRSGRAARLPEDQPREVAPLVQELNRLIAQNEAGLARARGHVANLGHALNTPLASLALALSEGDAPEDRARLDLVLRMQDRIRHHLGRARTAALGGPASVRTAVAPRIADIAEALGKIHRDRGVSFRQDVAGGLDAACEAQDFDEMAGNLMDNAFKWALSRVDVSATADGKNVVVAIDDDGAGIDGDAAGEALLPGRRLDERTPGTGFGLPIARELAELYGGELTLSRSPLGGLRASLVLPLAR